MWPSAVSVAATASTADVQATASNFNPAAPLKEPICGAQLQHTMIVEGCSQPCWDAAMQFHVTCKDVLLRMQVRYSILLISNGKHWC
jgi:hypothetical protein